MKLLRKNDPDQVIKHNLELVSMHIPKTAGTSFAEILKQVYGHKQVSNFQVQIANHQGDMRVMLDGEIFTQRSFSPDTKVIHGHFPFQEMEKRIQAKEKIPVITWLRDPVDRVVSAFHYVDRIYKKELSQRDPGLNILNTLKRGLMEYAHAKPNRNRMAYYLKGIPLESLFFVGILEHFEEDLAFLAKRLGWKEYPIPHLNKTQKREPLAAFKYDAIKCWNAQDVELYEQALAMRKERMQA